MDRRSIPFVVALLVAVVALVLLTRDGDGTPMPAPPDDQVETAPEAGDLRAAELPVADPAPADPAARRDLTRVEVPAADRRATIRGRCVDEDGVPLANVAIALHGWGANSERMQRHRLDHGEVVWEDPADVSSGGDGRFEHRFDPPAPYQFTCEATAEGRVRVYGRWSELAPGSTTDMGDVVLPRGVAVRGRVVDADGVGLGGQTVALRVPNRGGPFGGGGRSRGPLQARDRGYGRTDAAGRFEVREPLPEGSYEVEVGRLVVTEPREPVELRLPSKELRVVAVPRTADAEPTITGTVVDARGAPIRRASIVVEGAPFSGPSTGRDGSFVLRPGSRVSAAAPVELGASAEGFAAWHAPEPVAWGTTGLRIQLLDGPPLTVRVRRADDERPVERFGIVLAPIRAGGWSSRDDELLHVGDHEGGVLELPRATTGRFRLTVVPAEDTGLPPARPEEIEIELGVAELVDVTVAPLAERVIEVVSTSGEPVQGARVEVLEHLAGGEVTTRMLAMDLTNARHNSPDHVAALHDSATTDAAGRATVAARAGQAFALRLPGPGHVPTIVQPFRLDDEGPARVVVGAGATLRGRVEPASLVAVLREEAGLPPAGPVEERLRDQLPSLTLQGTGERAGESFPVGRLAGGEIPLGDDGAFVVHGVPPGTWDLWLSTSIKMPWGASRPRRVVHAGLVLAEGEDRELVVDLSALARHPVALHIRVDGAPHTGNVRLHGRLGQRPDGRPDEEYRTLECTAPGPLATALPAGTWDVAVYANVGGAPVGLPGPTFVVGAPGAGAVRVDVNLRTASCPILVLDPDGTPAAGVVLHGKGIGIEFATNAKPTDAAGKTTFHGPPCTLSLQTRPAPLIDEAAYVKWFNEHDAEPDVRERVLIDLGSVDLVPGGAEERRIRLPREWTETPK